MTKDSSHSDVHAPQVRAFAYLRTSSAANVGADKDSDVRQRLAIQAYADANGIEIAAEFYDAGVKGADAIETRPGFSEMLGEIGASDDVRMILIETASRFARTLMVQEAGFAKLQAMGVALVPVDNPFHFTADSDDPMVTAFRQFIGIMNELEKAMTVAKLKGARDRKRAATGRCEGRPQAPAPCRALATRLRGEGLSLRVIAERLADAGYHAPSGKVYGAESVKAMVTA
ncbi:MAG TPA: recombinase family protein [Stellaceae bacterium]|jgi:DNA invertase Pin-like site-specific DNA recombinase|nr:recombinase family protein [Stellaceae bacterium]